MTKSRNFNFCGLLIAAALTCNLSASEVPCAIHVTDEVTVGNPASPVIFCGDLLFYNFSLTAADNGAGVVTINGAEYNAVTGQVVLNIDPDLGADQDEWFKYQVAPLFGAKITSLDLSVGGVGGDVDELACSAPIPDSGPSAYLCPSGSFLGQVSSFSNDPDVPVFSGSLGWASPVYIFKDIGTSGIGSQLSVVDQSFETSTVPEPASMLLLSGGLLFVGLTRRRKT